MAGRLSRLGLKFEFVDAVDGSASSPPELAARSHSRDTLRLLGRNLTPGEIGCGLSHLRLYRRLLDSGLEEAVILEDDVILDPALPAFLRQRHRLPEKWELLHLHVGLPRAPFSIWGARKLSEQLRCVRLTIPVNGSFGYLIRRAGAEKLLQHSRNRCGDVVRVPADVLCGGSLKTGLRLYGIDPAVVLHQDGESTMPDAYALRAGIAAMKNHGLMRRTYLNARERAAVLYKRANPFLVF